MRDAAPAVSWPELATTTVLVFLMAFVGCIAAFALWVQDLSAPQVALLGSGNRLSLLVTDGPARLVLATGDDPIAFENALSRVRPLFARRIDVLLVAGADRSLLVPLAAQGDARVRTAAAIAALPPAPETNAVGALAVLPSPCRIRLGPAVRVTVETAFPFGADPATTFPAWRATVEHENSRIVVLSDGEAAGLFPPDIAASVLAVSGANPAAAWDLAPAVAFVANAEAIGGPEMRASFTDSRRPPEWGYRVFANEALRLKFVPGGVELPSEPAHDLNGTPVDAGIAPRLLSARRLVRQSAPLSRWRIRP